MPRALVLYSASKASKVSLALARRVPGLELKVIYFRSPFFLDPEEAAPAAAPPDGVRYSTKNLKREFLGILAWENELPFPCGACRAVILARAARLLRRSKLDFVIVGDLLGKGGLWAEELARLDQAVGLAGLVVRPLSGRGLPRPRPVLHGWWPESLLFDLSYGEEERLEALARELGIEDGLEASARCSLTDPVYLKRLRLIAKDGVHTANTLRLLAFKHFLFLPPDLKVVVAVDGEERLKLQGLFLPDDMRIYFSSPNSPLILVRADWRRYSGDQRLAVLVKVLRAVAPLLGGSLASLGELCYRLESEEETVRVAYPFAPLDASLSSIEVKV